MWPPVASQWPPARDWFAPHSCANIPGIAYGGVCVPPRACHPGLGCLRCSAAFSDRPHHPLDHCAQLPGPAPQRCRHSSGPPAAVLGRDGRRGDSARRMLQALADGETKPAALATLANKQLRATSEQLRDALGACTELNPVYRRLLKMALEELQFIEQHIGQLDQEMASLLSQHQDAVQRLAEVPGLGVDSAQQIIAELGATAASFPSPKHLSSWVGACPGDEESAGVSQSHRSPKGNRQMRRILNQCANAAVKVKGKHLSDPISSIGIPVGTQSNHRGDCASDLPTHLDHFASRGSLRETRPSPPREFETSTHRENDPATPKPRLSRRTADTEPSISGEEFSTLLGTPKKGQPPGWPMVNFKERRVVNRCPPQLTVSPGTNHLERASSGHPFVLDQDYGPRGSRLSRPVHGIVIFLSTRRAGSRIPNAARKPDYPAPADHSPGHRDSCGRPALWSPRAGAFPA